MATLTKAEIAEELQKQLDLEKPEAKKVVDEVFEEIRLSLEGGEEVKLSSFGNFELRDKKARPGRNPKTKEPKLIKARRVVTFRTGQKLKGRIEQYNGDNHENPEEDELIS